MNAQGYKPKTCCGRKRADGQPCTRGAGWGTATPGTGPCKLHGGLKRGKKAGDVADKRIKAGGICSDILAEYATKVDAVRASKAARREVALVQLGRMAEGLEAIWTGAGGKPTEALMKWVPEYLGAWSRFQTTDEGQQVTVTSKSVPADLVAGYMADLGRACVRRFGREAWDEVVAEVAGAHTHAVGMIAARSAVEVDG